MLGFILIFLPALDALTSPGVTSVAGMCCDLTRSNSRRSGLGENSSRADHLVSRPLRQCLAS